MVINCYYELPGNEWNIPRYFEEFYQSLKRHYPEHTINQVSTFGLPGRDPGSPCAKYNHAHMIIENDETKKYYLVTFWDKMNCLGTGTGWDLENCVGILTSSGVHQDDFYYKPLEGDFTPFSYLTTRTDTDKMIYSLRDMDNSQRIIPEKPMFKGYLYLFREHLSNDNRFDVKKTGDGTYLHYEEYVKYLNQFAINMSLNGAGEICFRDMEILGLGTALFRPKLTTKFHNPLIPDYHYISVDYDDLKGIMPINKFYDELSNRIYNRWVEVIKDRDFIDEVAKNGKKWFDENVPKEKQADILIKIIDFNKLL